MSKKIAVTIGDPNSIGAEIAVKAINSGCIDDKKIILFANQEILNFYNLKLNKNIDFIDINFNIDSLSPGQNTISGGEFSYKTLVHILTNIGKYNLKSIVTAPVSKYALSLAGYNFSGQTEILQSFLGNKNKTANMLFVANDFRVFLLTRHLPLADVCKKIGKEFIISSVIELNSELKRIYKINNPKIALCGLNPHSGENGVIGCGEIRVNLLNLKGV